MTVEASDDLYGLALADFVTARNQLARELAAGGQAEEAPRVKGLRKPTVAAWELNQVARSQPDLVAALRQAHHQLRTAASAEALRSASENRMDAIRAILSAADVTDPTARKMRSTLLAAATDPEVEEMLAAGRLDADLEPAGLGGFEAASPFATAPATSPGHVSGAAAAPKSDRGATKEAKARRRAEQLDKEADDALAEAKRLRADADRADRIATAAEQRATATREVADKARRT